MKVIKKPKFKEQVCLQCRAVVKIEVVDIFMSDVIEPNWKCPCCCYENVVDFGKRKTKQVKQAKQDL